MGLWNSESELNSEFSGNLTVRDNDVGWDEMKADEEDDAPTIAAVIDERPEELRTVLFFVRGNLETGPVELAWK